MEQQFDSRTSNFLNWLVSSANVQISTKVAFEDLRDVNQGRALVAVENIAKNETLFEIPRAHILNVTTSELGKRSPEIQQKLVTSVGHWEGLVLVILYEFKVLREQSLWWSYFEVLPSAKDMNNLIYWSQNDLDTLNPSLVLDRVGKDSAVEMYNRVLYHMQEFGIPGLIDVTWEEFVHVASVIMSYSFDVERSDFGGNEEQSDEEDDYYTDDDGEDDSSVLRDGYFKSMVPLADMLNSDTHGCNANLVYSSTSLKMIAIKNIHRGDQIYNIYGDHPNAEILRRYGYVEWSGSKFDFGEIPLSTVVNTIACNLNVSVSFIEHVLNYIKSSDSIDELFEGETIILDAYDCYADGGIVTECVTLIQVLCVLLQLPEIETYDEGSLLRVLHRIMKKVLQLIGSGRVTKNTVRLWEQIVDSRLKDYPSHAFREVTPDHTTPHEDSLRQRMAECVLQCEVRSIQNCFQSIENQFQVIDDEKLARNILKRKIEVSERSSVKRIRG